MKPSPKILDLVKTDVPFRPMAYKKDNHLLIGYEHTDPYLKRGDSVSQERAEADLKQDLEAVARQLEKPFRALPDIRTNAIDLAFARQFPQMVPLCDRQRMFDALVALAFHIGVNDLLRSSLWSAIQTQADEDTIRAEFERWVYEDGKPMPEHVARRQHEADHFFGND